MKRFVACVLKLFVPKAILPHSNQQDSVGYTSNSSLIPSTACIYSERKDVVLAWRNAGGFSIITPEKPQTSSAC